MMKKTWLFPVLFATAATASTAHASSETTISGILVVPDAAVTLYPPTAESTVCVGNTNSDHSGLGCSIRVDAETEVAPYADAAALLGGLQTALAPYDVTVTHTRPPKYVPYTMLLPDDAASAEGLSFTCTLGSIDCGALNRRRVGFTTGSTMNCMDPVQLHASLYAFGRMSGLEGVADPTDPMNYPPDFTVDPPVTAFVDACVDTVFQNVFDKEGNPMPDTMLDCSPTIDHAECEGEGDMDPDQQNSHQHLLQAYGAALAAADTTAPVVAITSPMDGEVFVLGSDPLEVVLDATVTEDESAYVGAMWTLQSQAFLDAGLESDTVEFCTNDACNANPLGNPWADDPSSVKQIGVDAFSIGIMPIEGEYTATLEVTDMHGNVSELQTVTFTVMGAEMPGTGGMDDSGGDSADSGPMFTTSDSAGDGGTGDGDGTAGADGGSGTDDGGGCSCTAGAGSAPITLVMFSLFGLGIATTRRRR